MYSHFGKYADVWKHLLLCSVLAEHKPSAYIDTNSAFASYGLESTPEQMHGIGLFLDRAEDDELLGRSKYFSLQSDAQSCPDGAAYLGSPALALHLLSGTSDKLIFCDFDDVALSSIAAYARAINSKATVETRQGDSRSTLGEVIPLLRKGVMIFFDPYEAFDPDENGDSYMPLYPRFDPRGHPQRRHLSGCGLRQWASHRNAE